MSQETQECNLCGSRKHILVYEQHNKKDVSEACYCISEAVIQRPEKIWKCLSCGLIFAQGHEDAQKYIDQYRNMVDEEYLQEEAGRRQASIKILKRIERYKKGGRLLDVGCANGFLLDEARRRGWDAVGVEVSKWAAAYAKDQFHLNVSMNSLADSCFPDESFDVVVMNDVVEHLVNPKEAFIEIKRILKKEGIACVSTPDIASVASRVLGAKWWGINKYHLFYFSKKTFEKMISSCGFEVKKYNPHIRIFSIHYWIKRIKPYNDILSQLISLFCKMDTRSSFQLSINFYDQIEALIKKKE